MRKKVLFLFVLFIMIFVGNNYAKYVVEYTISIADVKIDRLIPKITLMQVINSNKEYRNYANNTHDITIRLKVIETNFKEDRFNTEYVKILVGENEVKPKNYKIELESKIQRSKTYVMYLSGIEGNGNLKIKVPKGTIVDITDNVNEETILDAGIIIDNIAPVVTFKQEEIEEGKIKAKFEANEKIKPVNAWNISSTKNALDKEFACNVTYPFYITDYAQNTSEVEVNVTKATNIQFKYGARSQMAECEYGKGNSEIIGKNMFNVNPIYKIEMLFFRTEGNIEEDFIGIQNYMHTYWGEGIRGLSFSTETPYYHGYNPTEDSYSTMKNGEKAYVNREVHVVLGGNGINEKGYGGTGTKRIPEDIAKQYLFGVSGLRFKLKDESYYSIIYQIFVSGEGWQKVAEDGEEAVYAHDKPFSCYRVSLIPKTEKGYLVDKWTKDIGTNNMK